VAQGRLVLAAIKALKVLQEVLDRWDLQGTLDHKEPQALEDLLDLSVLLELTDHRAHRVHLETSDHWVLPGPRVLLEVLVCPVCRDLTVSQGQWVPRGQLGQLAADLPGCQGHKDHREQRVNQVPLDQRDRQDLSDNLVPPGRAALTVEQGSRDQRAVLEYLAFPVRQGLLVPRDRWVLRDLQGCQDHPGAQVNRVFRDHSVLPDRAVLPVLLDPRDFLVALGSLGTPEAMDNQDLPVLLDSRDRLDPLDLRVWADPLVRLELRDFRGLQVELEVVVHLEGPDPRVPLDRQELLDPLVHRERRDLKETTDLPDPLDRTGLLVDQVRLDLTERRGELEHREHKEVQAPADSRDPPVHPALQVYPGLKAEWAPPVRREHRDSPDLLEQRDRLLRDLRALWDNQGQLVPLGQTVPLEMRDYPVHQEVPDHRERWDRRELRGR